MDKGYVVECVRRFAEKARERMDVRQVVLFGSYAKGRPTDDSDIDVAVIADTAPPDWLEASAMLFRLRRDIDLAIEPVLLIPSEDRSGFAAEVVRTGEVIYSRE